jgi:hypothetical protein
MEVLQLKCGVSVNKMVLNNSDTDQQWVEVRLPTPPPPLPVAFISTFHVPIIVKCVPVNPGVHQQNGLYFKFMTPLRIIVTCSVAEPEPRSRN